MRKTTIMACAVTMLLVCACAGLHGKRPPDISIAGFRAIPTQIQVPGFAVDLRLVNRNREALHFDGVYYAIFLEGHRIFSGASNVISAVPGYGEEIVTLRAMPDVLSSVGLISDLLGQPRSQFAYALEVELNARGYRRDFRAYREGRIGLRPGEY